MNGIMVSEMWSIPRGTNVVQGNQMFVHPSTAMALKHNRTPVLDPSHGGSKRDGT